MKTYTQIFKRQRKGGSYIYKTAEGEVLAEALKAMRRMCKKYYKVIIYNNWEEPETGCLVEQTITDYKDGKPFNSITM